MDKTVFSQKPTLPGKGFILRPFRGEDADGMLAILAEPEVQILTGSVGSAEEANTPMTPEDVERTRRWYATRSEQNDRLDLAIVSESGEVVGEAVLNDWQPENRSCNFRILIGEKGRGHGYGFGATKLLLDYAFGILKLHRVDLGVFSFNPRAQHVYEKAGFVYEGTKRESLLFDGKWIDEKFYSLLETDPRL